MKGACAAALPEFGNVMDPSSCPEELIGAATATNAADNASRATIFMTDSCYLRGAELGGTRPLMRK